MGPTMTEQASKTANPEQPTAAEPVPPAATIVQPPGRLHVWHALGWGILGALLAVGIMMALPMRQAMVASLQDNTKSVSDIQAPVAAVSDIDTSTVRIDTPQMQH